MERTNVIYYLCSDSGRNVFPGDRRDPIGFALRKILQGYALVNIDDTGLRLGEPAQWITYRRKGNLRRHLEGLPWCTKSEYEAIKLATSID